MGVHPPEAMMHIPSLFQISPHIFEKFSDSEENFQNVIFSRKISPFSSAKISDDLFLVINRKFRIPPIFPVSVHFPPVSRKFIFPPTLKNVPPVFEKFTCSYILSVHFVFPCFDHDAFMHHPMHVLDAPVTAIHVMGRTETTRKRLCRH